MEVWVTGQPHLLYETVELLYAYVNRIPAVELTQEGPYCLPEAAIQHVQKNVLNGTADTV